VNSAPTPESLGLVTVGLLGGGVIGGGWAARLLINGIDVQLFDPDPDAERKVDEMLANARRAWSSLTDAPLPTQGTLTRAATPQDAATGVQFVQESAPENEQIKRSLLASASEAAATDVVFGGSKPSGAKPCGSSTTGWPPLSRSTTRSGTAPACGGHPWGRC
jgi:carnitine 3-dehydrogenase